MTLATEEQSLALIAYYGPSPYEHHESVRKSRIRVAVSRQDPNIDAARSILLEMGLRQAGVDVLVFIDSDVEFTREGYDRIVRSCLETEGVVGGAYLKKSLTGAGGLVGSVRDVPTEMKFYEAGGLYPAKSLGMGFTAIHRKACEAIRRHHDLPKVLFTVGADGGMLCHAFFMPLARGGQYIREDFSFCLRASEASVPLFFDTRPEVIHHGMHGFRLEDAAYRSEKMPGLSFQIGDKEKA